MNREPMMLENIAKMREVIKRYLDITPKPTRIYLLTQDELLYLDMEKIYNESDWRP